MNTASMPENGAHHFQFVEIALAISTGAAGLFEVFQ